jgi:hypothetical protein
MKKINHWSIRYIYNRLLLSFYERQNPDHPWLTQEAINILSTYLQDSDVCLEWGSGRSTIWLAQKVKKLISIESNKEWYCWVSRKIEEKGLANIDYRLIAKEHNYVSSIDSDHEISFDFILVDGPFCRDFCSLKALHYLKDGGMLVVDNANLYLPCTSFAPKSRSHSMGPRSDSWKVFLDKTVSWRRIWTTNGVSDTAFFFKPY